MNEVTAESLEMANDIYESRHAAGDKVSMPSLERELGIPVGKLMNYRSNRVRTKGAIESGATARGADAVADRLVRDWPLDRIRMRGNARSEFEVQELQGLANSIRATDGELQFAVGYEAEFDGLTWCVLVIGERRFRANELRRDRGEEVSVMPVRMVPEPSEKDFMVMNLAENNQRVNLKPSEEAAWLRDMLELVDEVSGQLLFSQVTIGEEIGKPREYVARSVSCLAAPAKARAALDEGRVALEVVAVIGSLPESMRDQATQEMIFGLGGAMTRNEARSHVANQYRRDLRRADFDVDDAGLTDAGACADCEWWGGNREDVGGKAAVHQCLSPVCFQGKQAAAAEVEKVRVLAGGGELVILSEEDSLQLFDGVMGRLSPTCGFVDLDLKPDAYFLSDGDRNRESVPKWRVALRDDMPTVHVAWDLECRKHDLVETRLAMVGALASPLSSIFRPEAAKGLLTKVELCRQNRIKNAVRKEGHLVCLEGARELMRGLGRLSFDSGMIFNLIEVAADQGLKPDDFIFLCEMLAPEMTRSEMTGRGFGELLKSTALPADEMLALLLIVLQVRSLRYSGFEPWCDEGPMAEICKVAEFSPGDWMKRWRQRRTVAERAEQGAIERENNAAESEGGEV